MELIAAYLGWPFWALQDLTQEPDETPKGVRRTLAALVSFAVALYMAMVVFAGLGYWWLVALWGALYLLVSVIVFFTYFFTGPNGEADHCQFQGGTPG